MIIVKNNGQELVSTNYWDSEQAKKGYLYLTFNAGSGRLLIPDSMVEIISEIKTGKYAEITNDTVEGKKGIQILFEDNSDSPYCIFISNGQIDRELKDKGQFPLHIYTQQGFQFKLNAKFKG